jgi:alanine dehydrogenase
LRIGVPKEIKTDEYRVALTPAGARELIQRGHEVLVETTAGDGSAFPDAQYERAGARIVSVDDAWGQADLLLKVKEPIQPEYARLREGLILFTYLHIAADEPLTRALADSGVAAVAYETVETVDRRLPLLAPMSEIAGRLAPQAAAHFLEKPLGGRGVLLAGTPGVQPGAVIVDVAIDQGGCIETAHPTTHSDPIYEVDGIIHYCVANMPGGVPVTSTKALTNATLPYVEEIAEHGLAEAVGRDPSLALGVNVLDGKITYEAVAEAHGLEYTPLADVLPLAPV